MEHNINAILFVSARLFVNIYLRSGQTLGAAANWKVKDFINREDKAWNAGMVREYFDWDSAKSILSMELPQYTVKTGYYYLSKDGGLERSNFAARDQEFVKVIWRLVIQPKWKVFLWKLFHDGIAAKVNLAKRGIRVDEIYDHCEVNLEDSPHIFRFCIPAKEVWESSSLTICPDSPGFNSLKSWVQHFILLLNSEDGKNSTRCALFVATMWGLWRTRNARCFNNTKGTISLVNEAIQRAMEDHETFKHQTRLTNVGDLSGKNDPTLLPGFNCVQLGKEDKGFDDFMVEADGSWDRKTTRSGIGCAVKPNHHGFALDKGGKHGAAVSVIQCEAWACLEAMKWARAKGRIGILLFTDSAGLLNNLQVHPSKDISIAWLLKEIRGVEATFQRCTILKVQRDQVYQADDIAKICRINCSNLL
ncbi:uncharacterized protein LOC110709556 [Chenopodium quinoa]|uniref:uncharacterized protein LOC110709556 n=1 Tax=Chenopodium quinoa TaxID=63459 RepID=UPI000B788982|nr:uncharacterized protein LOC110709556 [Chenopodium quinoa]